MAMNRNILLSLSGVVYLLSVDLRSEIISIEEKDNLLLDLDEQAADYVYANWNCSFDPVTRRCINNGNTDGPLGGIARFRDRGVGYYNGMDEGNYWGDSSRKNYNRGGRNFYNRARGGHHSGWHHSDHRSGQRHNGHGHGSRQRNWKKR
jgi:hypothetical protein